MIFKKKSSKKRSRAMLSAYSIIMILIILLGIASHVIPRHAKFVAVTPEETTAMEEETTNSESQTSNLATEMNEATEAQSRTINQNNSSLPATPESVTALPVVADQTSTTTVPSTTSTPQATEPKTYDSLEACEEENDKCVIVDGSGVVGAKLYQILIAPILGFENAIDVCIFVMILGGFLAVVARTKALETGIKILVKKLKGKEYLLILLLMFIFSILGTTYGFLEESVGFYVLIAATMYAAGLDPLVGVATILLGAGSGVLGSTINPFATGVALSAMKDAGIEYNQGTVLLIATVLWLTTLAVSAFFVVRYAKKVQRDKGSTFLSLREQAIVTKSYGKYLEKTEDDIRLTTRQIITLIIFAITFLVMIIGFVPWGEFNITFFDSWTGWLTGASLGNWWFFESALWFLISAILIAIVNGFGEHGFIDAFIDGADDMIGVVLVIAVARGASVLMASTYLDNYIIHNATDFLATLPEYLFVPLNYFLHIFLSVLVPSSSGLATLSTPIVAPVAANLGYSTEVAAMTIVASNGLVNLITPTCGAIMGGLALAKIDYSTWLKWALKVVVVIIIINIIVLSLFSL